MANREGVADSELPGKTLEPNAPFTPEVDEGDDFAQFGRELEKPDADAGSKVVKSPEQEAQEKRFEYHQSRADKAEAEAEKLRKELGERSKYDPLIDVLKRDDQAFQYLQNRLTAPEQTQPKQLEMPQRPDGYTEVEAFSNPESASWKYRKDMEAYKDSMLVTLHQQNQQFLQQQEMSKKQMQMREAQREQMNRFRKQVAELGLPDDQFADFFEYTQTAPPEEMVAFWNWKRAQQDAQTPTPVPVPEVPGRTAGSGRRPAPKVGDDLGSVFVDASRRM